MSLYSFEISPICPIQKLTSRPTSKLTIIASAFVIHSPSYLSRNILKDSLQNSLTKYPSEANTDASTNYRAK